MHAHTHDKIHSHIHGLALLNYMHKHSHIFHYAQLYASVHLYIILSYDIQCFAWEPKTEHTNIPCRSKNVPDIIVYVGESHSENETDI